MKHAARPKGCVGRWEFASHRVVATRLHPEPCLLFCFLYFVFLFMAGICLMLCGALDRACSRLRRRIHESFVSHFIHVTPNGVSDDCFVPLVNRWIMVKSRTDPVSRTQSTTPRLQIPISDKRLVASIMDFAWERQFAVHEGVAEPVCFECPRLRLAHHSHGAQD
jgi:hypothetical protein